VSDWIDWPPNPTGGNRERNCGRAQAGYYGLGEAWLAAVGADEVEDGLGGLDEVGVVGDLGVRLRLLHAPQLGAAVAAPQRQPRHCRRRSDRLQFGLSPQQIWDGNSEQTRNRALAASREVFTSFNQESDEKTGFFLFLIFLIIF